MSIKSGQAHKHRKGGELTRFLDAQTGTEIRAVAIDEVTSAKIGTRPMRIVSPTEDVT
ncbi:hypothetical protein [Luteibacter sp. 9135]|uniref:hypothetical protein n=1 Tax=Luteibacter sp. 9135 TaxID=1500893 RepID=UPI001C83CFE6|nr:hypothetical protein [Luteibacter sp. 9135]